MWRTLGVIVCFIAKNPPRIRGVLEKYYHYDDTSPAHISSSQTDVYQTPIYIYYDYWTVTNFYVIIVNIIHTF